jgi:threonine synthase
VEREVLEQVLDEAFDFPIPLVEVEPGVFVLELFHGPTHAFKDVGARFLARLAATFEPGGRRRTVLVATSGDTGGAVAAAFHGLDGFRVIVLFPKVGISDRQRRQMTTLGDNVRAVAVDGSFDDCQRLAKAAFMDADLSDRHALMSANSINVGRLLPQALYFVHAAALLGWAARPARYVVPSGNLGNLCAGLLARRAGLPTVGLVAATNANRGFVDLLRGGSFDPRPSVSTSSSAMDVGDPSNLERILWLYGGDLRRLRRDVVGVSVSDREARDCIREVHERTGYVLDPHSAVAWAARSRAGEDARGPTVVLATAHPAKFPDVVEAVVGHEIPLPPGLARTRDAEEHVTEIPPTLEALRGVLAGTGG